MQSKIEVSRGPRGLRLHLPSGRTLDCRADAAGVGFIERMLRDLDENAHYLNEEARKGYLGGFPTQHVLDAWELQATKFVREGDTREKEEARKAAQEKKDAEWKAKGIDASKLDFKL